MSFSFQTSVLSCKGDKVREFCSKLNKRASNSDCTKRHLTLDDRRSRNGGRSTLLLRAEQKGMENCAFPHGVNIESRDINVGKKGFSELPGSSVALPKVCASLDPLFSVERVSVSKQAASLLQLQPLYCLCLQGPAPWSEAIQAKLGHMWALGRHRSHKPFLFHPLLSETHCFSSPDPAYLLSIFVPLPPSFSSLTAFFWRKWSFGIIFLSFKEPYPKLEKW